MQQSNPHCQRSVNSRKKLTSGSVIGRWRNMRPQTRIIRSSKAVAPAAWCRKRAIPFSIAHSMLSRNLRTPAFFHFLALASARLHTVRCAPATSTTTRRRPPPPSQSCSQARKTSTHSPSGRHRLSLTSHKRPLRGGRSAPASRGFRLTRTRSIATDRVDRQQAKRLSASASTIQPWARTAALTLRRQITGLYSSS